MRKLRILFCEVIGLALLIGWLIWKYPELVDGVIPWVSLVIAWHVTWEYVLDTDLIREVGISLGKKIRPMFAWPLVFLLGGSVSLLYWTGINKSLVQLSALAAARVAEKAKAPASNAMVEGKPQTSIEPPSPAGSVSNNTKKESKPAARHAGQSDKAGEKVLTEQPLVFETPYGTLALRCQRLGDEIKQYVQARNEKRPSPAKPEEFNDWLIQNDSLFHFYMYGKIEELQKDLAKVNIREPELDALIKSHAEFFARRNDGRPVEEVKNHPILYHTRIEEIERIGKWFEYLGAKIPPK